LCAQVRARGSKRSPLAVRRPHHDGRDHLVIAPAQRGEHLPRALARRWLAEDHTVEDHDGVRGQHASVATGGRRRLRGGDRERGGFRRQPDGQRLLVEIRRRELEVEADRVEQIATSRRGRGEDEGHALDGHGASL